jgi:hypothetical protein
MAASITHRKKLTPLAAKSNASVRKIYGNRKTKVISNNPYSVSLPI